MRFGPAFALVIAALTLVAAMPLMADSGSDAASSYVSDKDLNLCGYVSGYDSSMSAPKAYLFVVYKETVEGRDVYKYVNLNEDPDDTTLISATVDSNNKFSIVVPQITSSSAEYYLYFDAYSIKTVPWTNAEKRTIIPDDTTWPATVTEKYTAYKLPHEWAWNNTAHYPVCNPESLVPSTEIWITDDKPTDPGLITLARSMGQVTGHVSNTVRGEPNDLGGVLVEFYNTNGARAAYTTTGNDGTYTVEVATGDYEIRFYRGNYDHEPINITVIEGTNTVAEVTMEYKMDNTFFGYDLVHFMMFIGAALCVGIIIISIGFQYRRIKMNKSGSEWILDDMPEEKDD